MHDFVHTADEYNFRADADVFGLFLHWHPLFINSSNAIESESRLNRFTKSQFDRVYSVKLRWYEKILPTFNIYSTAK